MSMYGPVFNLIAPFVLASSGRPHPADVRQQDSVRDGAAPHHPGHTPGGQGAGVWPVAGPAQADVLGHAHGPPVLLPGRPPQPEVRHHRGVQEQPDEEGTHPVLRVPIFRYTPSVLPWLPYSVVAPTPLRSVLGGVSRFLYTLSIHYTAICIATTCGL